MSRNHYVVSAVIALASISFLLTGCATEHGSTYSSTVSAEQQRKSEAASQSTDSMRGSKEEVSSSSSSGENGEKVDSVTETHTTTRIEVDTSPSGAAVYLNGQFVGYTPVVIDGAAEGAYSLRVSKPGFYTLHRRLSVGPDTSVKLDITLARLMGFLAVDSNPADAELLVDGERVYSLHSRVPAGMHQVTVRRFGYTAFEQSVDIQPEQTTHLQVQLDKAPFELQSVSASRAHFNPNNPGPLGTTTIRFRVTSFGSGTVTIEGPGTSSGSPVRTIVINSFTTWDQEAAWNGKDNAGNVVPDGTYIAVVEAQSADGGPLRQDTAVVYVNSALAIRFRDMLSGNPGLAYGPIPDTLPDGSFQVATEFLGHVGQDSAGTLVGRFPVMAGIRYGLPFNLEATVSAQGVLYSDPNLDDGSVSIGLRWQFLDLPLGGPVSASAMLAAKGTFLSNAATDTLTNFDSVGFSLPLGLRIGPVGLSVTPEIVGNSYPVYPVSGPWTPDLYIWGYGRAALYVDTGTILTGISAAVRTRPLSAPPGTVVPFTEYYQLPILAAAEFHVLIPGTSVVVGITGAAEISSPSDYYIMAGGGIGFLY
ncbi:MAG TPA: PEGA domain-containing protein [Spirochaetia bacterium]|nr:PEGA domain-containing protein [Spirochaetia bacterium]